MTRPIPEPQEHLALIGLFTTGGSGLRFVYERDNITIPMNKDERWFGLDDFEACRFADIIALAAEDGRELVRLYRADDPAITDAFNAGVEAAAKAIETHAEAIGWYEGGGVWADAIEEARKAVKP